MTATATRRKQTLSLKFLLLLGVPALGTTFAITVVSSYGPVLLAKGAGPIVVGVVVGSEGLFAILMPLLSEARLSAAGTLGARLRPLLVTAPIGAAGLTILGLVRGPIAVALGAAAYFAVHFVYLTAYQALYADVVPDEQSGRSRSAESVWRLLGAGAGLIAGGFLLDAWHAAPFVLGGILVLGGTVVVHRAIRPRAHEELDAAEPDGSGLRGQVGRMRELLDDPRLRWLLIANTLWNFALNGIRAFVVLYFVAGLGRSPSFVSGVIFPIVAVGLAVAAPLAGRLADRFGHATLLRWAVPVYGVGLCLPGISHATWVVPVVPLVSAAAATVMTIPFALMMTMMPEDEHGVASGLFTISRGIGGLLGPLACGVAIDLLRGPLSGSHGYAAMWFVVGPAALASWPMLRRLAT